MRGGERAGIMRSKLFVPACRPASFSKALATDADAICFDLEDMVLPAQKAEARNNLRKFFSSGFRTKQTIMVRVNSVRTAHFAEDLSAAVFPAVSVLTLPKVEDPEEIRETATALLALEKEHKLERAITILATIESPRGLRLADAIAGADARVAGLQLGLADMFEHLGIQQDNAPAAHQVRLRLRLAAGEAGVPCYDTAFPDFKDEEGFAREAMTARSLGFAGKSCIHLGQIAVANRIFSPDAGQIAASSRIVKAARVAAMAGAGSFALDGRMIDEPFVKRAEAILQLAKTLGLMSSEEQH